MLNASADPPCVAFLHRIGGKLLSSSTISIAHHTKNSIPSKLPFLSLTKNFFKIVCPAKRVNSPIMSIDALLKGVWRDPEKYLKAESIDIKLFFGTIIFKIVAII